MNLLTFPAKNYTASAVPVQPTKFAEQSDVDVLYEGMIIAAETSPNVASVLQNAEKLGWSRDMTVMVMSYMLLMHFEEFQGHMLELMMGDERLVETTTKH